MPCHTIPEKNRPPSHLLLRMSTNSSNHLSDQGIQPLPPPPTCSPPSFSLFTPTPHLGATPNNGRFSPQLLLLLPLRPYCIILDALHHPLLDSGLATGFMACDAIAPGHRLRKRNPHPLPVRYFPVGIQPRTTLPLLISRQRTAPLSQCIQRRSQRHPGIPLVSRRPPI